MHNNFLDMYKNEAQRLQNEYQQNMNQLQQSMRQYQGGMNNPQFWQNTVQPMLNPQSQQMQQPVQQADPNQMPEIPIPVRHLAATAELKPILEDIKNTLVEIKSAMKLVENSADLETEKEISKTKIEKKNGTS